MTRQVKEAAISLEGTERLPSDHTAVRSDIEAKRMRITRLEKELDQLAYDQRSAEISAQIKQLQDEREVLNAEFRRLSLQAESRAKLNIKREEQKRKRLEMSGL